MSQFRIATAAVLTFASWQASAPGGSIRSEAELRQFGSSSSASAVKSPGWINAELHDFTGQLPKGRMMVNLAALKRDQASQSSEPTHATLAPRHYEPVVCPPPAAPHGKGTTSPGSGTSTMPKGSGSETSSPSSNPPIAPVPEPSGVVLAMSGLGILAVVLGRKAVAKV